MVGSNTNFEKSIVTCFKMLIYIQANGVVKARELAEIFNVSEKQIRRYIKSLRLAGVDIQSKGGKYNGGYYIDNGCPLCKLYRENIKER